MFAGIWITTIKITQTQLSFQRRYCEFATSFYRIRLGRNVRYLCLLTILLEVWCPRFTKGDPPSPSLATTDQVLRWSPSALEIQRPIISEGRFLFQHASDQHLQAMSAWVGRPCLSDSHPHAWKQVAASRPKSHSRQQSLQAHPGTFKGSTLSGVVQPAFRYVRQTTTVSRFYASSLKCTPPVRVPV